jgi:Zn-dependent protease
MLFLAGFGWGKPVPVNPYNLRNGTRSGMAMVSFAGPLSNLVAAGILAIPIRLHLLNWQGPTSWVYLPRQHWTPEWLGATLLGFIIFYCIILAAFNLLPIAPLDGFSVAIGILPRRLGDALAHTERYGPALLLTLVALGYFTGFSLLWRLLNPLIDLFSFLLIGKPL